MFKDEIKSWKLSLTYDEKSPRTIETYLESVGQFAAWCDEADLADDLGKLRREDIEGFIVSLRDLGRSPSTVSVRFRSLKRFFGWMVDEEIITISPMARMTQPKVPEVVVPVVRSADIEKLLKVTNGKTFVEQRDRAILALLIDCGMRRAEITGLKVNDIDFETQIAVVMGKGNRPRACPFGMTTARDLDRYLRARTKHPRADDDALWLGPRGQMTPSGIAQVVEKRSLQAGLGRLHPHQFRHTFAHEFLSAGGQETDLMRLTGWKSHSMVSRYAASTGDERARKAHKQFSPRDHLKG